MSTPQFFVVNFEHAHRSFKCVRLEVGQGENAALSPQWICTIAGRPVWSFEAREADTSDTVRQEVARWWDARNGLTV